MSVTAYLEGNSNEHSSDEPAATTTLVAQPEESWSEAFKYAWNDDTLDFFLSQWEQNADIWDNFSLIYSASSRDHEWLKTQMGSSTAHVFVMRAVYEHMFGERITPEQVSTLAVQRRLWQSQSISEMPSLSWELLPLDPGVADELLELLWNKELVGDSRLSSPPTRGKKRRLGFPARHSGIVKALLANKSLTDEQIFKWLVRTANQNAPHKDTRTLSSIVNSVVDHHSASRRTLRTALRICFRAMPPEGDEERNHYYQVARRTMFSALSHPQMDYSILDGLRDAGLIDQIDYEGYTDELALHIYEQSEEQTEPDFTPPKEGTTYALENWHVDDFSTWLDLRQSKAKLDLIPDGFPLPDGVWDAVATELEDYASKSMTPGLQRTTMMLNSVNVMLTKRPAPPKEIVLRILEATMALEPVNGLLYYCGYAVKQFRDQAKADGMDADNLPLEWILQIYS